MSHAKSNSVRRILDQYRSNITESTQLPDFLIALETHQAKEQATSYTPQTSSNITSHSAERPSSRASSAATGSKLRYTAYEAPRHTPKLRRRTSTSSSLSSHSDISRASEELARTFTPGELALATGRPDLHDIGKVGSFSLYGSAIAEYMRSLQYRALRLSQAYKLWMKISWQSKPI